MAKIKFKTSTNETLKKLFVKKKIFHILLILLGISLTLNIILVTLLILLKK